MEKKPILFEGACLLSILGSCTGFLTMFMATFFFREVSGKIELFSNSTSADRLSPIYFALLMAAYSVSVAGAIKLYRMQRSGLYFYLSAQAAILLLPAVWLGSNALSLINLVFTLVFSGVYLYYRRYLS